jgi:hypothetical protein
MKPISSTHAAEATELLTVEGGRSCVTGEGIGAAILIAAINAGLFGPGLQICTGANSCQGAKITVCTK